MTRTTTTRTTTEMPATWTQRPMRPDDAARWAELLTACEAVDGLDEHWDEADAADELTDPDVDLDRNTVLLLDGERTVAGQVLHLRTGSIRRLFAAGVVHPDYRGRGAGTALLALGRQRAGELGAQAEMGVADSLPGVAALAAGSGLTPVRWWSDLRRDLADPVADAPLPDGLVLHPLGPSYDADRWDERLRAANNAAFADHWGSAPMSAQSWVHLRTGSRNFRAEVSAAACTPEGAVAGFVLGFEFVADTARTGVRDLYVDSVGTLREWRGRGVASALLAHVLAASRAGGYARSSLTVDADNPTGALGVYDRAGYTMHRRRVTWAAPAPEGQV